MFKPISEDDFVQDFLESNTGFEEKHIRQAIQSAVEAKKNGATCQCGRPIWAAGTAVAGYNSCYSCITGETDNSEDFEIESVCEEGS